MDDQPQKMYPLALNVPAIEDLDTCLACGEPIMPNMPCPTCTGDYHEFES